MPDGSHLTRRTFVSTVAALGATTLLHSHAAAAAPARTFDRAIGAVRLNGAPKVLARSGGAWFLTDLSGAAQPTRGLDDAEVTALAATPTGLVAVGSTGEVALWESPDGLDWQRATLPAIEGELTAVGSNGADVLVLGAQLTPERSPKRRIALRRSGGTWTATPLRGLEPTDELSATALAAVPSGWVATAVDVAGSHVFASRDGVTWTPHPAERRLADAAVKALVAAGDGVRWLANGIGGSAALTGALGAGRAPAPVPQDAHAVGLLDPETTVWLADGRLVTA